MIENDFKTEINRLVDTYGKTSFGTERLRLIWLEVQDLPGPWFRGVVSGMIGGLRQAPMVPDFRDAAASERERTRQAERREESRRAKTWASQFASEDERLMAQMIVKRSRGEVSESDWVEFLRVIDGLRVRA
jgi:hypothetical protein